MDAAVATLHSVVISPSSLVKQCRGLRFGRCRRALGVKQRSRRDRYRQPPAAGAPSGGRLGPVVRFGASLGVAPSPIPQSSSCSVSFANERRKRVRAWHPLPGRPWKISRYRGARQPVASADGWQRRSVTGHGSHDATGEPTARSVAFCSRAAIVAAGRPCGGRCARHRRGLPSSRSRPSAGRLCSRLTPSCLAGRLRAERLKTERQDELTLQGKQRRR